MSKEIPAPRRTILRRVLFLCSGNHYRSRFCEELFNHHSRAQHLSWEAFSRGLLEAPAARNVDPMSEAALDALRSLRVRPTNHLRLPLEVRGFDFLETDLAIAVYEREHRPIIESRWSMTSGEVEYWNVPDIDEQPPVVALERLRRNVDELLERLARGQAYLDAEHVLSLEA